MAAVPWVGRGEDAPVTLRGRLRQAGGEPPAIAMSEGKVVRVHGDEQTEGVLRDGRLKDADFEVSGHYDGAASLRILPIHKRAMYVHKDGKRLYVTYWCAVCSIRTYTPGTCWCCQDETELDLKDKLDN